MSGKNTPYRLISTATTNIKLIAACPTNGPSLGLKVIDVVNVNTTTAAYVKLYDKATAPVLSTDTPFATFYVAKASSTRISCDILLSNGLGIAITGALADTDTTAIGANDVVVNIEYSKGL